MTRRQTRFGDSVDATYVTVSDAFRVAQIMEIIRTGDLQRINYAKTDDLAASRLFCGIYGVGEFVPRPLKNPIDLCGPYVGPNTARKWFHQGLKSLDDIRRAMGDGTHKLSAAQEVR